MAKRLGCLMIALLIIVASGLAVWQVSHAQTRRSDFPETGHVLRGDFHEYYWSVDNPILVYGYPITDVIEDEVSGRPTQYFQRAVFMLFPDAAEKSRVQPLPLGEYLYTPGDPIPSSGQMSNCFDFPETGKQVCYAFLDFFETNGGVEQFGYPISNFEYQFGRIVQYFQRARFEWYPELPSGQRVKIADIGSEYFNRVGGDQGVIPPIEIQQKILSLKVRAYPAKPVVRLEDAQVIHVIVQDQNHQPVPKAEIEAVVQFPSGEEIKTLAPVTDRNGITTLEIRIDTDTTGRALVKVRARFSDLDEYFTETSFRIWW